MLKYEGGREEGGQIDLLLEKKIPSKRWALLGLSE